MKHFSLHLKIAFFAASAGSLSLGVIGGMYATQYLSATEALAHTLATSDASCPSPSAAATLEAQSFGDDDVFTAGCGGIF